ncbi:uncharacterized protein CEXT_761961, partial [Caerostris extrusa]
KGDYSPEERTIIIKLRNEGKTFREIGKIVGRTHSSIQRVINNYTSSKSIISKPRSGRPSKLTAREKRYVFKSSCPAGRRFPPPYFALNEFPKQVGITRTSKHSRDLAFPISGTCIPGRMVYVPG